MSNKQAVLNYYDATEIDYKILWSRDEDQAIHFGYYDHKAKDHKRSLLRLNEVLAEKVEIQSTDKVFDAGCGYGGSALWLAKNIGCEVTGVTIVPKQARQGNRIVENRNLNDKVKIYEGDYSTTKQPDNTFDVYWAVESLVHAPDRRKVFEEAERIVKTNGRIVIAEYTLREAPPLTNKEKNYLRLWLDNWSMPHLLTPSEYKKELEAAGFVDVQVENVTENVRPSLKRLELLCRLNYFFAITIAQIIFKKERLQNFFGSWRQIQALKKGLWQYSIITAKKI